MNEFLHPKKIKLKPDSSDSEISATNVTSRGTPGPALRAAAPADPVCSDREVAEDGGSRPIFHPSREFSQLIYQNNIVLF